MYDMTDRVAEIWDYYDKILDDRLERIANLSGVDRDALIKINPADYIEKSRYQTIRGYKFKEITDFINENKTDSTFLISPMDAIEETAEQIGYKTRETVKRKIRASKCEVYPLSRELTADFCRRNHRQTIPNISKIAVSLGLVYDNELIAIMEYDMQTGAVRGAKTGYELVRLAICRETQVHGGASKLQKACEDVLRKMGIDTIYSYSNATINTGSVYEKLGFTKGKVTEGQPFVIMNNNDLVRLITLHPYSTDKELSKRGQFRTHVGGNIMWVKEIGNGERQDDIAGTGK